MLNHFKKSAVYKDINNEKLSHSVLLVTPDTYALEQYAHCLVKALMCSGDDKPCGECVGCRKVEHGNNVDVLYYPKATKALSSAEITELLDKVYSAPYESDKQVFVISNANGIDRSMQNKLLKSLEEPPAGTYFVLLATEDNNILPTIKSRCRIVRVPKMNVSQILQVLREKEVEDSIATLAVSYCDNNCSRAINYALNPNFKETVALVEDIFRNFRKSWQMLDYSSKLYNYNENFEEVLDIFLNICARAVALLCGKQIMDPIASDVAKNFSIDALVNLNLECNKFVRKRRSNCNFNSVVDGFLFMILEVRHKWPIT